MAFMGAKRGVALSPIRPRVIKGAEKMGLPWDAYYVLTKANAALTNSKVHPNSGAPNYNIAHNVSDLIADADLHLGEHILSADEISSNTYNFSEDDGMEFTVADHTLILNFDDGDVFTISPTAVIASGEGTFVGIDLNGDIKTDRWLESATNLFLGEGVCGDGTLEHTAGSEGYNNVGLGNDALKAITKGYHNIALGYQALQSLTTGARNIAIGSTALRDNTVSNTIAIGYGALQQNVDGIENMAIGYDALQENTDGQKNIGIGTFALQHPGSSRYNIAIGVNVMRTNAGWYGIGIGYGALSNTGGSGNVAIGYYSLAGTGVTASDNTYIGKEAGRRQTDGDNNVGIGSCAGDHLTSGSRNILIGYQAGDALTTGSDNIIIGYDLAASAVDVDDELNIGGVYKGVVGTSASIPVPIQIGAPLANYTAVSAAGDVTFVGGAGLAYGDIYGLDETITCTNEDTWYQITFDTAGPSNGTTVTVANNEITVLSTGAYKIGLTVCCYSAVAHDFEVMVKKNNGTVDIECMHLFQSTAVANQVENISGNCIASLSATDTIEAWVQCTDAAGINFIIDHVDLNITQFGGT